MGSEQEIAVNIAQNVKQLREARGLTQQQMAARIPIVTVLVRTVRTWMNSWINWRSLSASP